MHAEKGVKVVKPIYILSYFMRRAETTRQNQFAQFSGTERSQHVNNYSWCKTHEKQK